MEFLNLSLFQFLAAAGAVSAFVVALYFLDRRRRRVRVASLRFWTDARMERHPMPQRRIQQPWSLLLQLLALLLLVAALADVRWTVGQLRSLDHVLVLDSSSWMLARQQGTPLMDIARRRAAQYVRALPAGDRVLLVTADANPKPAAAFEEDLALVEQAIEGARPGSTALNLGEALNFARQMLATRETPGDIIFVGGQWIADESVPAITGELNNLRVIPVDAEIRNVYFEKITLQPNERDPGAWTAHVSVGNRGGALPVPVRLSFGGAPIATRTIVVPANSIATLPIDFRTGASGWVDLRLDVADGLRADNAARVELPHTGGVRVGVCTQDRNLYEALFQANPGWAAVYDNRSPCPAPEGVDLVILDRVLPAGALNIPALWIAPPEGGPFRGESAGAERVNVAWKRESAIADGLRSTDLAVAGVRYLESTEGDEVIAEATGRPIALARRGTPPQVVWGFHPLLSEARFEVTTPVLFANSFRWLAAESAVPEEISVRSAGNVLLAELNAAEDAQIQVSDANGNVVPVTRGKDGWRFFAGATGLYRVRDGHQTSIVSLTLPEAPRTFWEAPAQQVIASIPSGGPTEGPMQWWLWLAAAGMALLLLDALLFDRRGDEHSPAATTWNPFAMLLRATRGRAGRGVSA